MSPTRRTFLQLLGLTGAAACLPSLDTLEALAPGAQLTLDTDSLPFYLIDVQVVTMKTARVELCANGMPFLMLCALSGYVTHKDCLDMHVRKLHGHLTVRAVDENNQPCSVYATLQTVAPEAFLGGVHDLGVATRTQHLIFSEVA